MVYVALDTENRDMFHYVHYSEDVMGDFVYTSDSIFIDVVVVDVVKDLEVFFVDNYDDHVQYYQ